MVSRPPYFHIVECNTEIAATAGSSVLVHPCRNIAHITRVTLQVNRKNKVKSGESSDESEGETVTETQQVSSFTIFMYVFHTFRNLNHT